MRSCRRVACAVAVALLGTGAAAQPQPDAAEPTPSAAAAFAFAVVATDSGGSPPTSDLLRAIDRSRADLRFIVHFESSTPSSKSCSDEAIDRRRQALDASTKAVVPVPAGSEWAYCGDSFSDPVERLQRLGDALFGSDQSLGQAPLPWLRQSALPRFHRYRENVRWQVGRVLFATMNLPDGNNGFRIGAGRNGEFEERIVSNRAWLDRTFRLATERKLLGVVLFVDAAPRFGAPLRVPDLRTRDRDGYYEWKVALREHVAAFKGRVLLVQGHRTPDAAAGAGADHPLRDAGGHALEHMTRVMAIAGSPEAQWLRIDVDPADPKLFHVGIDRAFDDPSGELYGPARVR